MNIFWLVVVCFASGLHGASTASEQTNVSVSTETILQQKFNNPTLNKVYTILFGSAGLTDQQMIQQIFGATLLTNDTINTLSVEQKTFLDYLTTPAFQFQTVVAAFMQNGAQSSQAVIAEKFYQTQTIIEQKFESEALNKAYNMLVHPVAPYTDTIAAELFSNYVLNAQNINTSNYEFCSLLDYSANFKYGTPTLIQNFVNLGATTKQLRASLIVAPALDLKKFTDSNLNMSSNLLNQGTMPVWQLFYNGFLDWTTINTLSSESKTMLDYATALQVQAGSSPSTVIANAVSDLRNQGAKLSSELQTIALYLPKQKIVENIFQDSMLNKVYNVLVHSTSPYQATIVQDFFTNFLLDPFRINMLSTEGKTLLDYASSYAYISADIQTALIAQGALTAQQRREGMFFQHQPITQQLFVNPSTQANPLYGMLNKVYAIFVLHLLLSFDDWSRF